MVIEKKQKINKMKTNLLKLLLIGPSCYVIRKIKTKKEFYHTAGQYSSTAGDQNPPPTFASLVSLRVTSWLKSGGGFWEINSAG